MASVQQKSKALRENWVQFDTLCFGTGWDEVDLENQTILFFDDDNDEFTFKYSLDDFRELADEAGFDVEKVWTDRKQYFSLQLLRVNNRP